MHGRAPRLSSDDAAAAPWPADRYQPRSGAAVVSGHWAQRGTDRAPQPRPAANAASPRTATAAGSARPPPDRARAAPATRPERSRGHAEHHAKTGVARLLHAGVDRHQEGDGGGGAHRASMARASSKSIGTPRAWKPIQPATPVQIQPIRWTRKPSASRPCGRRSGRVPPATHPHAPWRSGTGCRRCGRRASRRSS